MPEMFQIVNVRSYSTSKERGNAYGQQAREKISVSIATYARLFAANGMDWAEARRQASKYTEPVSKMNQSLLDEMEGVAAGAGVDLLDILVLNCRTELLSLDLGMSRDDVARAQLKNKEAEIPDCGECTAVCIAPSASSEGHTIFAQNWDWKGRQREALVILLGADDSGCMFTTLTEAGQLAKLGLSNRGISLGLNLIRSQQDGQVPGIPIHCLIRHILTLPSVAAIRSALAELHRTLGFAAASNIPCVDSSGDVACFEVSPAGWDEERGDAGVIVHSNHFLCPSLVPQQRATDLNPSSAPRLKRCRELVAQVRHTSETCAKVARLSSDRAHPIVTTSSSSDLCCAEYHPPPRRRRSGR
jgi:isopenicillin-N N-acyltransferase like protein